MIWKVWVEAMGNTVGNDYGIDKEENKVDLMALTDTLTGFGNDRFIEGQFETLTHAGEAGQFWIIDVDGFQEIRKEKGCLFGDEVLCDIARFLGDVFPATASIARNTGDEFWILVSGDCDAVEAEKKACAVKDGLKQLYAQERIFCEFTVSIGIVLLPAGGAFEEVLDMARRAVGHAKQLGGDACAFFEEGYTDSHLVQQTGTVHTQELFEMLPRASVSEYNFRFLSDARDPESTINMLMLRSLEFYNVHHCAIYMVQENELIMRCKYEARTDKNLRLYNQVIGFSPQGWKDRMERLQKRELCAVYDSSSYENTFLAEIYGVLPMETKIMHAIIYAGDTYVGDILLADYTGTKVWTQEDRANLEAFTQVLGYYLLVQRRGLSQISHEAKEERDFLTGLYSSEFFLTKAEEMVKAAPENQEFAIVYLDIGNFKVINRDWGYDMGDRVLKECARFLEHEVPDVVLTGRIYSDKFAVLCRKDTPMNEQEVLDNAYRINDELRKRIRALCKDESILIHTGMYTISPEGDMRVALSRAKMAKNIAKRKWTSHMVVYESWMSDSAQKSYELIGNVDEAIANREFLVYLQPKVDSETRKIIGAEALVRWRKQDGTMVFPDEFIPVFEKNGKIVDVDFYVYEEVFRYLRDRMDRGLPLVPISMNVSRVHLMTDGFIDKINELLEVYQVPCEYLEFELTENVYVEKLQEALPFIENIRRKHIKVSIDDFGSGYSSLNVISSIPLDVLKLDKAFMKRGGELTKKDRAVISHLVDLAKDIELEVLCEGVETQLQADFVRDIGCNAWQGYCFAKPMPMAEFDEILNKCLDCNI